MARNTQRCFTTATTVLFLLWINATLFLSRTHYAQLSPTTISFEGVDKFVVQSISQSASTRQINNASMDSTLVLSEATIDGKVHRQSNNSTQKGPLEKQTGASIMNWLHYTDQEARKAVTPIWKCHDSVEARRGKKFVFVHVFKTAGSSMRQWLLEYAVRCGVNFSMVSTCTNVKPSTMKRKGKKDQSWSPCQLLAHLDRDRQFKAFRPPAKVNNTFVEKEVEIMAGHFRIGSTDHLQTHDTRHFSFFRNAVTKFVSAKLYIKMNRPNVTMDDVIKDICNHATNSIKNGEYYSRYSDYLLTPQQRGMFELKTRHNEAIIQSATRVIMANLVEQNVLVGVVERMDASMELLQYVLGDNPKEKRRRLALTGSLRHKNPSKVPSRKVLQTIRDFHPHCYATLFEFQKYEQMITDFATEMHVKQYEAFQNTRDR